MKLLLILLILTGCICFEAESHYREAMQLTRASDGTDATIEGIMAARGFEVDALDTSEPILAAKIKALFTCYNPGILQKVTDDRGITSVVYVQGKDTFALDYLDKHELDSLSYTLSY